MSNRCVLFGCNISRYKLLRYKDTNKDIEVELNKDIKLNLKLNQNDLNINQLLLDTSYKMIDKNYLNFELIFVYKDYEDKKINEPVSRLLHGLIRGDCLIYSKGEKSFNDLSKR